MAFEQGQGEHLGEEHGGRTQVGRLEGAWLVPGSDCPGQVVGGHRPVPWGPTLYGLPVGSECRATGKKCRATAYGWQVMDYPRAWPWGPVAGPCSAHQARCPGVGCVHWEKGQSSLIHSKLLSVLVGNMSDWHRSSREGGLPGGGGPTAIPHSPHLLVPAVCERAEPVAVCTAEGEHQQHWPAGLLPPWCLPWGQVELLPPEGQDRWA